MKKKKVIEINIHDEKFEIPQINFTLDGIIKGKSKFQPLFRPFFRQTGRSQRSRQDKQTAHVGVHRYGRGRFAQEVKMSCEASPFLLIE